MMEQRIVRWIETKYQALAAELSERGRRRWAAVEAASLGRGGVTAGRGATGLAPSSTRRRLREGPARAGPPPGHARRPRGRLSARAAGYAAPQQAPDPPGELA